MTQELRKFEIRKATEADFSAIIDLVNRSFHQVDSSYVKEDPETDMTVHQDGPFFVALDNNQVIGCVMVNLNLRGIIKLAVEKSYRNQGLGCRLMTEAESYARSQGWPVVYTAVASFHPELLRYYKNLGYEEMGITDFVFGPDNPYYVIRLSKILTRILPPLTAPAETARQRRL